MSQPIIDYVAGYYSNKVETHGATPQGVDWNGTESQETRFQQLLKVCPQTDEPFSLLDYGCGYGALLEYLQRGRKQFRYVGFDCSTSMIDAARQQHPDVAASFVSQLSPSEQIDFTVASGIFNVRGEITDKDWLSYCLDTIKRMHALSTGGFSFNMLTSYSDRDKMREYLYYADPCFIFDFCKRELSRHVALLHDYGLYEFTILVRK